VKDYQASIKKLRTDAAEAALIRDLATDKTKREMFDRLHQHLNRLADEVEQAMKISKDQLRNRSAPRWSRAGPLAKGGLKGGHRGCSRRGPEMDQEQTSPVFRSIRDFIDSAALLEVRGVRADPHQNGSQ
jgi:hypothetical protein